MPCATISPKEGDPGGNPKPKKSSEVSVAMDPDNINGKSSEFEPVHTSTIPQAAGTGSDGYLWKYLYSISPSDIVKFVTDKYIPLPKEWGDVNTVNVKNAAVDGKIETVIVKNAGSGIGVGAGYSGTVSNIPISGDGTGGSVTVNISGGSISEISSVVGGSNYTYANVRFITGTYTDGAGNNVVLGVPNTAVDQPQFEVIIPPKGCLLYTTDAADE